MCTAESDFDDEEEPLVGVGQDGADVGRDLGVAGYNPSAFDQNEVTPAIRGSARHRRRLYDNSGANIDVLVVWTKDAECLKSSLLVGCVRTNITENNMRGLIDLAIAETNAAFVFSGINTTLRLVHAYLDSNYTEPTLNPYPTALDNLRKTTDGKLDSVHAKRTLYGADAVHMIIGKGGSCGVAYSGPTSAYMFSVSRFSCATGYYSFGHEIMHNLGAKHDRGSEMLNTTTTSCNVTTASNYGYRDPNANFRSIMAYDCTAGACNKTDLTTSCTRVQRFSNTFSLYNGEAIGNDANDNARQINAKKSVAASFYPAMNCQSDTACNDTNPTTVDTCNIDIGVCVFTPGP